MQIFKDNYITTTGHGDSWKINIAPPKRKVKPYFYELVDFIEELYAKHGKFNVLYSGGVDSEFVCEIMLKLKMDFNPVIYKLTSNDGTIYNRHDIDYAWRFCEKHSLTPIEYECNFDKFVDSGKINEVAESVECPVIEMPALLHMTSQLDGFTLMGWSPPYLWLKDNAWKLLEMEFHYTLGKYYQQNNLNGCPYLLNYSPELFLSFLLDPVIHKLVNGGFPGKISTQSSKALVYNNNSGFELEPYDYVTKKRIKYTGYETIHETKKLIDHPNIKLFEVYKKKWWGIYEENYFDLVKRLSINQ